MSASLDADVNIIMRAHDRASPEVASAVNRINGEYRKLRQEQLAITRGFELQNSSLIASTRVLQTTGRITNGLLNVYQNYNIQALRVSDANRRVRETTEEWNRAMAEGDWDRAAELSEQMAKAKEEEAQAAQQATIMNIAYGASIAASFTDVVKLIPQVKALAAALRGAAASSAAVPLTGALGGLTAGAGAGAGKGLLGKIGGLKGVGGIAGAGLIAGGLLTSEAITGEQLSNEARLLSVAQSAGGGALMGAMFGPIGAAIGGGAGLVAGLATNYGEEFGNLFSGKGFLSNADAAAPVQSSSNITINNTFTGYDMDQVKNELNSQLGHR